MLLAASVAVSVGNETRRAFQDRNSDTPIFAGPYMAVWESFWRKLVSPAFSNISPYRVISFQKVLEFWSDCPVPIVQAGEINCFFYPLNKSNNYLTTIN